MQPGFGQLGKYFVAVEEPDERLFLTSMHLPSQAELARMKTGKRKASQDTVQTVLAYGDASPYDLYTSNDTLHKRPTGIAVPGKFQPLLSAEESDSSDQDSHRVRQEKDIRQLKSIAPEDLEEDSAEEEEDEEEKEDDKEDKNIYGMAYFVDSDGEMGTPFSI